MKYFIITVDTEGDNLWSYTKGQIVQTENALYIPRFQELCEKYNFKPVWLTNYEMASDQRYVDYIKPKAENGLCEIGIHVHAWNTPPIYELHDLYGGNPYLIEYPEDVMKAKFKTTYDLLVSKFLRKPVSHRSGRWAMDEKYFKLLEEFDIRVDCSYTPTVSWANSPGALTKHGTDYSFVKSSAHYVGNILEMPTSVTHTRLKTDLKSSTIKGKIKTILNGRHIWLRPACTSLKDMKWLSLKLDNDASIDYLMFMMHSSELMPGGSPYFPDLQSIERMYAEIEEYFSFVTALGYKGITIAEYNELFK